MKIKVLVGLLLAMVFCGSTFLVKAEEDHFYKDITVMTYNVLTTSKTPISSVNEEGTRTRGEMFIDLLNQVQPDTMGLNEVTSAWKDYIQNNVITYTYDGAATYALAGLKSNTGKELMSGSNEYSPILYRSDKYKIVEEGGNWFSTTPDAPSKYGDILDENGNVMYSGMQYNRVFSYAVFKDIITDELAYIHIQAHFDHRSSDYINVLCSKQIKEKADALAANYNCPVVIAGDLNAKETAESYRYLADGNNGYVNVKYMSDKYSESASCPGYGAEYNPLAEDVIDHIFVSNGNVGVYKHDIIENPYISDHSCVYGKLSLHSLPKLTGINVNGIPMLRFSPVKYSLTSYTDDTEILLEINADVGDVVSVDGQIIKNVGTALGTINLGLQAGNNLFKICVEDERGARTVYRLNVYRNYGEAIPIISEIFPNADVGYKYFEVTNMGSKSFKVSDYFFLWGNITNDSVRTWEGKYEPKYEYADAIVGPGKTVVFWFTYGGNFNNNIPTIEDFNNKYGTNLTDDDIIMSETSVPIQGYLNGQVIKTYTIGGNRSRGMRIARAKDNNGNYYAWSSQGADARYGGPTISISSYHNILGSGDLNNNQLFKFKHMESENLTAVSEILNRSKASPGVYDTKLGNEIRDSYSIIEAEEYNSYAIIKNEGRNIGETKAGSWVYYANVDFGTTGAEIALFHGAVKSSNAGGRIEIYMDGSSDGNLTNATLIGSCTTVGRENTWSVYEDFTCKLNQVVTGIHNITLKFIPDSTKTFVINLDYFKFDYKVDATNKIEGEWAYTFTSGVDFNGNPASANWQKNTSATGMSNSFTNNFNLIGHTVNGTTAKYKSVDFGDGGITGVVFNMALRVGRCAGTVEIYVARADGSLGEKIGYCTVMENEATEDNYNTYKEFKGAITNENILGVHDIVLKFTTGTYYVGNIDYFKFTKDCPCTRNDINIQMENIEF